MSAATERSRDRLSIAASHELDPHSLVGTFFLETVTEGDAERVRWQGCVVAEPHPGWYLVETFDWLVGASFDQRLVQIAEMREWRLFDDAEWMRNAYDHQHAGRERGRA